MSLILAALLPLITITVLSVLFSGVDFLGIDTPTVSRGIWEGLYNASGWNLFPSETFSIDSVAGAIAMLSAVVAIASVIGLQLFGSGLGETSVRTILLIIAYTGLWSCLSLLSISTIKSIEYFGGILYALMTIIYVVGVFQKLSGV